MPNKELFEYIKKELGRGIKPELIRNALIKAGWETADIDTAWAAATGNPAEKTNIPLAGKVPQVQADKITSQEPLEASPSLVSTAVSPETVFKAPTLAAAEIHTEIPASAKVSKPKFSATRLVIDLLIIVIAVGLVYLFRAPISDLMNSKAAPSVPQTITPDYSRADFVISDISVSPVSNGQAKILITVSNKGTTGSDPLGTPISAELSGGLTSHYNGTIGPIPAGAEKVWELPIGSDATDTAIQSGTTTIKVLINADKTTKETDYANDQLTKNLNF